MRMVPLCPTDTKIPGVVKPLEVVHWLVIALPEMSFTPVVVLILYVLIEVKSELGVTVKVLFEFDATGDAAI